MFSRARMTRPAKSPGRPPRSPDEPFLGSCSSSPPGWRRCCFGRSCSRPSTCRARSMEPTLLPGDRMLVLKFDLGTIHRGEIIVFKRPPGDSEDPNNEDLVKRVIGLPGQTIYSLGSTIYIDGKPIAQPWLPKHEAPGPRSTPSRSRRTTTSSWATTDRSRTTAGTGHRTSYRGPTSSGRCCSSSGGTGTLTSRRSELSGLIGCDGPAAQAARRRRSPMRSQKLPDQKASRASGGVSAREASNRSIGRRPPSTWG